MEAQTKYQKINSDTLNDKKKILIFETDSAEKTEKLGSKIAGLLKKRKIHCVVFTGPFGSGKTTMIRGIIKKLTGKSHVTSPSFTMVHEYREDNISVFHCDFYRIKNPDELESIGFREYENGFLLIEWPESAFEKIPENSLKITLDFVGLKRRKIIVALP
ncbi:MAG TPA: tRNA (adenosine(37)-N6)-threonylcarbamoyltransferase complex ATPase subunit type 1 TsaE [bacterium]|nr:tRNA (adenosine(37)-N6)-threonylcarbamoyltransferase complex ATPase subunit type 1 TsaE [bacterium]